MIRSTWVIIAIFHLGCLSTALAQYKDNQILYDKVSLITKLVDIGNDSRNPKLLIRAADILLETPKIRPLNPKSLPLGQRSKYFDPKALLDAARLMIPIDKKHQRRKIEKRIQKLRDYEKMTLLKGTLYVEPVKALDPEEEIRIPQDFGADRMVDFRLPKAEQLQLSIYIYQQGEPLEQAQNDSPILLSFTPKSTNKYEIGIRNLSKTNAQDSTTLMIMH